MEIEAIEEAFIRGDWDEVLTSSKEKLLALTAVHENSANGQDDTTAQSKDALATMYLQSVYEMAQQDELETAAVLMQSLSPLPFHLSLQWIKFLIAMDRKPAALELLNEQLQQCVAELQRDATDSESKARYIQVTEVLVLHLLLPTETSEMTTAYITKDRVLDEETKQRLLQAVHTADQAASKGSTPSSSSSSAHAPPPSTAIANHHQQQQGISRHTPQTQQPSSSHPQTSGHTTDPSGDLLAIGGTALAVAAVAISLYRYRDRLRDAVAEIGPAVSKGLADAKYALFES